MDTKRWLIMVVMLALSIFMAMFIDTDASGLSFISILPPIIAISAAFILRQVIVALFTGLWFGAWLINGQGFEGVYLGLIDIPQKYALNAMLDRDHVLIILTSLFLSGMVGVLSANGGMMGVLNVIIRWANNRKRVQLSTAFMGMFIFFDDYSNTLIVGNTMRPVTDRTNISREKLAYIVDSTAAPVASIAVISLWIGYQVGLIEEAVKTIDGLNEPYLIFLNSIAYSFYPILAIMFVFFIALSGRDFGPMLAAEQRAAKGDVAGNAPKQSNIESSEQLSTGAINAVLPIFTLITSVMLGIYVTGEGDSVRQILGSADSLISLMIASFLASAVAITLSVMQKILNLEQAIDSWINGMSTVITAVIILVLSWSLAAISTELHTADYLISVMSEGLAPAFLPAVIFVLAGIVSLGTGTSWGTMGILMPLVIPLSWGLIVNNGVVLEADMHIVYSSIAAVLAGAVWGDHCSPISDTTILSSMASQCNHVDHVRTQMPYALVVGAVGIVVGSIPVGLGMPWWVAVLLAASVLWFGLKRFGQVPD